MRKQIDSKNLYVGWQGSARVFYSYQTPIVVVTQAGTFATSEKFSVTTTKHQNYILGEYLNYPSFTLVTQAELKRLIDNATWD